LKDIYATGTIYLKLNLNGIRIGNKNDKIGKCKDIGFKIRIKDIHPEGGTISCLFLQIMKRKEEKYTVAIKSYYSVVDEIEKELEKIKRMVEKNGGKIKEGELVIRRYETLVVNDGTGECELRWWNPPEIKIGDKFKFVYLAVKRNGNQMLLSTCRMTYYEKVY